MKAMYLANAPSRILSLDNAFLNEKDPPVGDLVVTAPTSLRARLVSEGGLPAPLTPRFPNRPLGPDHLPSRSGYFGTRGSRRTSPGSPDPSQAPAVVGGAALRGSGRRSFSSERVGRGRRRITETTQGIAGRTKLTIPAKPADGLPSRDTATAHLTEAALRTPRGATVSANYRGSTSRVEAPAPLRSTA